MWSSHWPGVHLDKFWCQTPMKLDMFRFFSWLLARALGFDSERALSLVSYLLVVGKGNTNFGVFIHSNVGSHNRLEIEDTKSISVAFFVYCWQLSLNPLSLNPLLFQGKFLHLICTLLIFIIQATVSLNNITSTRMIWAFNDPSGENLT